MRLSALLFVGVVGLTGCSTTERADSSLDREQVHRFLLHLNNANRTERWRDALVEMGRRSPGDRDLLLQHLEAAYDRSMAYGGYGVGMLRPPGRYRVMEVVGALGRTPRGLALLQRGLKEGHRVGLAAAVMLASWGDTEALSTLEEAVQAFPDGDPDREKGLLALRGATKPSTTLAAAMSSEEDTVVEAGARPDPVASAETGAAPAVETSVEPAAD